MKASIGGGKENDLVKKLYLKGSNSLQRKRRFKGYCREKKKSRRKGKKTGDQNAVSNTEERKGSIRESLNYKSKEAFPYLYRVEGSAEGDREKRPEIFHSVGGGKERG